MPRLILFDVNETLLDLRALDTHFERLFGDTRVMAEWFGLVLRSSLVATITSTYHNFGIIAGDALAMTAAKYDVPLSEEDRMAVLQGVRSLPTHSDVRGSLTRLKNAGFRLATVTNSPPPVLKDQLTNAGIIDFFEQTLSVDAVQKFKPAPEVYQYAAQTLGLELSDICMVAAHDWDIAGAMRAGMAGAFVARPGMVLGPLQEAPTIVGDTMDSVVDQIIAKFGD